jgi:acylphosphatase
MKEENELARFTAWVHGEVQGVGFRWWTRSKALELGLVGSASNLADGRVEVVAQGRKDHCERLLATLRGGMSPGRVVRVVELWSSPRGDLTDFVEK